MNLSRFFSGLFFAATLITSTSQSVWSQNQFESFQWEFNEGGGLTVIDNSGDLQASLGVVLDSGDIPVSSDDSPSGAAGDRSIRPNGGLIVDDSAQQVLAIEEGPITVEAWYKLEDFNNFADIIRYGNSYKLGFTSGQNLVWTFLGIEDVDSGIPVEVDGIWHHYAAAWEPGVGTTFFFDGEEVAFVETANTNRALQSNLLSIGSDNSGGSPFLGLLDRVRIHNAVLSVDQLDSDPANPAASLASTVAAYQFNENGEPFANSAGAELPAVSLAAQESIVSVPRFNQDDPSGESTDYSLQFDGDDQIIFVDENDVLNFDFEDFTLEAWVKFDSGEQIVTRPVLISYGVGGQNGYSFSIVAGGQSPDAIEDSPSGNPGDFSAEPRGGIIVRDADNPQFAIQDGPITLEAWVKFNDFDSWTDIARYGSSYKAGFGPNGELVFTFLGVEDVLFPDAQAIVDQQWHHYAYGWEPGNGVTFFVDGEEVGFAATGNTSRDLLNNTLSIGSSDNGGSPVLGQLDRVRIHNSVLTAGDLDSNAATEIAPLDTTVAAYNFDEGSVPFSNAVSDNRPATSRNSRIAVTTFGIIDQFSDVEIPDDGAWHHIAASHVDGLEFRFFLDGRLEQTIPFVDGVRFAEVFEFFMGSERNRVNPYIGLLDRVRVTRGALSEEELDFFPPAAIPDWELR